MSKQVIKAALEAMCCMRDMVAHPDNLAFIDKHISVLQAALAEPEQEPDGISWLKRDSGYFTAPTPRKPLTDEEIVRLMVGEDRVQLLYSKPGDPYFSEFAEGAIRELVESGRAIERAHGIGEQHE